MKSRFKTKNAISLNAERAVIFAEISAIINKSCYLCWPFYFAHYIHFDEVPFENCIKVSNLTDVRDALYKNEWTFEERYWKAISKHIQTMINIPWA